MMGERSISVREFFLKNMMVFVCAAATLAPISCAATSSNGASFQTPAKLDFFSELVLGGSLNGVVYLEIPAKADSLDLNNSDHSRKWASFFGRALLKGWNVDGDALYWGTPLDSKWVDMAYVKASTEFHVGDTLQVRTPSEEASVRIVQHRIHCEEGGGDCLLLALGQTTAGSVLTDAPLLLAARRLPRCNASCVNSTLQAPDSVLGEIKSVLIARFGLDYPKGVPAEKRRQIVRAYVGHYTRMDQSQFLAYVALYPEDAIGEGSWVTAVLDSNLTVVAILGHNEPLHILPLSIADINQDGLHEIWGSFSGIEGQERGILFFDSTAAQPKFRHLSTLYSGTY